MRRPNGSSPCLVNEENENEDDLSVPSFSGAKIKSMAFQFNSRSAVLKCTWTLLDWT